MFSYIRSINIKAVTPERPMTKTIKVPNPEKPILGIRFKTAPAIEPAMRKYDEYLLAYSELNE